MAAATVAEAQAAKYSRKVDLDLDGFRVNYSEQADQMRKLAARLRAQAIAASGGLGTPFVGGVSVSARDSAVADTDRVAPLFTTTMQDMHEATLETNSNE